MQGLKDRVSEKIKNTFAELVPEETWQALVNAEVEKFKEETIPRIVKEELEKIYRKEISEEILKPEYQAGYGGIKPGEAITKIVAGLVPEIIARTHQNVIQDIICQIQNQQRGY